MNDILSILNQANSQGSFFTRQTAPTQNLQMEVGNEKIKFPLTHQQTKSIIRMAQPAKFGWKDQTLLDKKVRDVWEIPKSKIKIDKRLWNKTLLPLLDQCQSKLGLSENVQLKASLHNLLIYEPGQFFRPHQDSEKLEGMVATLVVVLPCKHSGGDLIIDHKGDKKRIQPSRTTNNQLTCVAFYADCYHEVKPVATGYRVALTYNLVLSSKNNKPCSSSNRETLNSLTNALKQYFDRRITENQSDDFPSYQKSHPPKWVYLLDHQYTEKGLTWQGLKREDQINVNLIKAAATALDLKCYLTLADIQETWDCDFDYSQLSYRRRRKRYWEEDEEILDEEDLQLHNLIDSNISLQHWLDPDDHPANFAGMSIADNEITWTKANNQFNPFESEYEGYMGNYGNTLDRWYHRAAIILWRDVDHYPMLCKLAPEQVVENILSLANDITQLAEAQKRVEQLLPFWQEERQFGDSDFFSNSTTVFTLARQLQSATLAKALIEPLGLNALTTHSITALVELAQLYGTKWCIDRLNFWSTSDNGYRASLLIPQFSTLMKKLAHCVQHKPSATQLSDWLFQYQFDTLKESHNSCKTYYSRVELAEKSPEHTKELLEILKGTVAVNNPQYFKQVLDHTINDPFLYPPLELIRLLDQLAKIKTLLEKKWGLPRLSKYITSSLTKEVEQAERKTDDWSICEPLNCACDDCSTLSDFLQAKGKRTLIWPLAKARRLHIHRTIDAMGLPVSHETKRTGSPHKLVLNKLDQLFTQERARKKLVEKALAKMTKKHAEIG